MRVVIVEDDSLLRSSLVHALERHGITVTGSFPDAIDVAKHVADDGPDVALLDLDLGPGPTGLDVARALRSVHASIGLVLLTTYEDPRLKVGSLPSIPAGLQYLSKGRMDDVAEVVRVLHAAARAPLAPPPVSRQPGRVDLTAAQIEVLRMVAEGLTTQEIAARRGVSVKAVEQLLTKIYDRLDLPRDPSLNQRVQLTHAYLTAAGLVD